MAVNLKLQALSKTLNDLNTRSIGSIYSNMSVVVAHLMNPYSSIKDIKHIIESDPPLCAKILRKVNSVHYRNKEPIITIEDAIQRLGFSNIRDILMTHTVCKLFKPGPLYCGYSRERLWRHCYAVAIFCKKVCEKLTYHQCDALYSCALLHDIGKIVVDQLYENEFKAILERYSKDDIDFLDAECEILGYNHAELGHSIVESWGVTTCLSDPILHHHDPFDFRNARIVETCILYLADHCTINTTLNFCNIHHHNEELFNDVLKYLEIDTDICNTIMEDTLDELNNSMD